MKEASYGWGCRAQPQAKCCYNYNYRQVPPALDMGSKVFWMVSLVTSAGAAALNMKSCANYIFPIHFHGYRLLIFPEKFVVDQSNLLHLPTLR